MRAVADSPYDLVIFDLDGTLIDSIGDIADALGHTLGRELSDKEVAGWVGAGVHELLRRAGVTGDLDEVARRYRARYAEFPVVHTRSYLRVKETLRALRCAKAVATNKPGGLARTVVERLGLAGEFALVLGEDDVGRKKPDPLIVDIIRGKLGTARTRTLYVGDSVVDAETAAAAGVDLCAVSYGYEDQARLAAAPAKFRIDRFADLLRLVAPA
jgi:phosphoglycolate phosphatase